MIGRRRRFHTEAEPFKATQEAVNVVSQSRGVRVAVEDASVELKPGDPVEHVETGQHGEVSERLDFGVHANSLFAIIDQMSDEVWVLWAGEMVQKPVRRGKLRKLSVLDMMAREAARE